MDNIDQIVINFSEEKLFFLNICLGYLLFGVALDIKVSEFKRLFDKPKPVIVGLISQLILMPILTLGLIFLMKLPVSMSLGMILVAACPGGNVSNYAVHLAKANAALSVLLTSVSTLAAIVITPVYFSYLGMLIPDSEALRQSIYVDPINMVITILKLIVIPLVVGMAVNHFYPVLINKIKTFVRYTSLLIFAGIVFAAVLSNVENILNYIDEIFLLVFIHNALALCMGYYFAKANRLPTSDVRAISIETGIQNTGLALILIFNFFNGLGGMALVAAWWGIWHLFSGFAMAMWWSRK